MHCFRVCGWDGLVNCGVVIQCVDEVVGGSWSFCVSRQRVHIFVFVIVVDVVIIYSMYIVVGRR